MKGRLLLSATALAVTTLAGAGWQSANAIDAGIADPQASANGSRVSDFDLNQITDAVARALPTAVQQQAWETFAREHPQARIRWHQASGSVDALYGFAGPQTNAGPEDAALAFVAENSALFGGIDVSALALNRFASREALGGHLLRFDQTVDGVKVEGAGLGMVLDADQRVLAVFGPVYPALNVSLKPSLDAAAAVAGARADLAGHARLLPSEALSLLEPGFQAIESQLGPLLEPHPELRVVMAPDGPRAAWSFYQYSRNPFGLFKYSIDAATGEVLQRIDQVRYQEEPTDLFADYFPTFPTITEALQDDCAILDANGDENGTPLGQLRIKLRKFDQSNRVTGADGVLTGDHALIQNALPSKAPFAQPAAGTWFFDSDELPLKGRTEERDHLEEPSEHQDEISQFIYITQLIEYLDYLHKEGDAVHNPGLGTGDFPDSYPNESTPLTGTVHIPNVLAPPDDPSDPDFFEKLLGLDNAFAVPVATEIAGQEVVINPTAYGHGFLFNNLAIDFAVPMHEGTHATITPIAGFEGAPEGGALNEGQADLWAYTIGETPVLGAYPVAGCKLRDLLRERGDDPDSWEYIRSAQSQIRYSQLGTRDNQYQVHRTARFMPVQCGISGKS